MASELRVDTLKDSSGSNSVGMAYVSGGSAKARGQHAAGTLQSGALNHSSITDNGVGIFTHNFTSSFANTLYSHVGSCTYNSGASTAIWTYMREDGSAGDTTTGSIKVTSAFVNAASNRTNLDFAFVDLICFGDLA